MLASRGSHRKTVSEMTAALNLMPAASGCFDSGVRPFGFAQGRLSLNMTDESWWLESSAR